jgi:hypothetical protein
MAASAGQGTRSAECLSEVDPSLEDVTIRIHQTDGKEISARRARTRKKEREPHNGSVGLKAAIARFTGL